MSPVRLRLFSSDQKGIHRTLTFLVPGKVIFLKLFIQNDSWRYHCHTTWLPNNIWRLLVWDGFNSNIITRCLINLENKEDHFLSASSLTVGVTAMSLFKHFVVYTYLSTLNMHLEKSFTQPNYFYSLSSITTSTMIDHFVAALFLCQNQLLRGCHHAGVIALQHILQLLLQRLDALRQLSVVQSNSIKSLQISWRLCVMGWRDNGCLGDLIQSKIVLGFGISRQQFQNGIELVHVLLEMSGGSQDLLSLVQQWLLLIGQGNVGIKFLNEFEGFFPDTANLNAVQVCVHGVL